MFHGNTSLRIAHGLKGSRGRIPDALVPQSRLDHTLNLATWSIRAVGKTRRLSASIHYIAEIVGRFDVVSIVELRKDLTELCRVMPILGRRC
jgi:hypothetical protein